ncbi:MAG: hypothetical protein IPP88_19635 [Betaproteobacteria bacterium]|nr:hypothetical protein [Betaproteobacteria bacterium]
MRFALTLWLLVWVCATTPAFAEATAPARTAPRYAKPADIPVEAFFRRAEYSQMAISPDGNRLAAVRPINGRDNLVVIDFLAGKLQVISNFKELDVVDFVWVSNDRLYFRSADLSEVSGATNLKGAYAVDVDGKNIRDLTFPLERAREREARRNSILVHGVNISFRILSRTFDGSGDVIAEIFGRSQSYADVYRFNTRTGEYKLLTVQTPGNVVRWVLDRHLEPRIAIRQEERKDPASPREQTIWHRPGDGKDWEMIGHAAGKDSQGNISPLAFDYDNKTLYVSSSIGRDRRAIFKYDIAERKLGEKLLEHPLIGPEWRPDFQPHKESAGRNSL